MEHESPAPLEVPLTHGQAAIIDVNDKDKIAGLSWYAVKCGRHWYAATTVRVSPKKCRRIYMHRLIHAAEDGSIVDHVNRNTLDNRKSNLRVCTKGENAVNSRKRPACYSRFRGVTWCKRDRRWKATVTSDGRAVYLGSYLTEEEAARAYNAAAVQLHGEFVVINEIPGLNYEECIAPPVRNRKRGRANGLRQRSVGPRAKIGC